jgi:hypothetical protein
VSLQLMEFDRHMLIFHFLQQSHAIFVCHLESLQLSARCSALLIYIYMSIYDCRGSPRVSYRWLVAVVRAEVGMCCRVVSRMVNSVAVVRAEDLHAWSRWSAPK